NRRGFPAEPHQDGLREPQRRCATTPTQVASPPSNRRSLTSIFRHAFPPRPDSTLRRRRGANPCSMGGRRDLGLGRNHRPVSENCSEALTGSSWPIPLKNSLSVRLIWPLLALPMIMSWGFSALNDVIVG